MNLHRAYGNTHRLRNLPIHEPFHHQQRKFSLFRGKLLIAIDDFFLCKALAGDREPMFQRRLQRF